MVDNIQSLHSFHHALTSSDQQHLQRVPLYLEQSYMESRTTEAYLVYDRDLLFTIYCLVLCSECPFVTVCDSFWVPLRTC